MFKLINRFLNSKNISKKKLYLGFVRFKTKRERGTYWWSFIQSFINPGKLLITWTLIIGWIELVKLRGIKLRDFLILGGLVISGIVVEFVKWRIGHFDYRKGIWKTEREWGQKDKVMAPFNVEMKNTLKEVCKRLGIEHKFDDKWEK